MNQNKLKYTFFGLAASFVIMSSLFAVDKEPTTLPLKIGISKTLNTRLQSLKLPKPIPFISLNGASLDHELANIAPDAISEVKKGDKINLIFKADSAGNNSGIVCHVPIWPNNAEDNSIDDNDGEFSSCEFDLASTEPATYKAELIYGTAPFYDKDDKLQARFLYIKDLIITKK